MNLPKLYLAPMAGYTDLPFRLLAIENGADVTTSEMVSAKGLYYGDKKSQKLLETDKNEKNYGIQIFGSEPEILKESTQILNGLKKEGKIDFDFIDFNAGCPAPKIVKNGDGSALLNRPDLLGDCLVAIKEAAEVPVTVKTRSGFKHGENLLPELIPVFNEAGVDRITIHPRTRSQFYSGSADWDIVKEALEKTQIPVVLSGDIKTPEDAKKAIELGVDGLMIGRKAVEDPGIFNRIKDYFNTGTYKELTKEDRILFALDHLKLLKEITGETSVIPLRKTLASYVGGIPNASKYRKEIFSLNEIDEAVNFFENLK